MQRIARSVEGYIVESKVQADTARPCEPRFRLTIQCVPESLQWQRKRIPDGCRNNDPSLEWDDSSFTLGARLGKMGGCRTMRLRFRVSSRYTDLFQICIVPEHGSDTKELPRKRAFRSTRRGSFGKRWSVPLRHRRASSHGPRRIEARSEFTQDCSVPIV